MKISFKLFALLITYTAYGQQADSFAFLGNSFDKNWRPNSIKITADGSVSSNAINTTMFTDVFIRTEFTPAAKQKFVDGQQQKVNLYSFASVDAEYKLSNTWGVYAKTEKLQAKVLFGLNALTSHKAVSSAKISLYTAPMGEYIDASVAQFAFSEQTDGTIKGVGVDLGLDLSYAINNKNSIGLALRDLNLTRMLDYTSIELDTSLRFTGIGYDFIRDTNTLQQYVDSNYLPIVENAREKLKWTTLPSRINLTWNHKLSKNSTLVTSLQSVDIGKYGITGTVGLGHEFTNRFKLYSSLGYGNYSGILWQEAVEYRFKRLNVYASVQGLHAIFVPKIATNYGVSLGITTHF